MGSKDHTKANCSSGTCCIWLGPITNAQLWLCSRPWPIFRWKSWNKIRSDGSVHAAPVLRMHISWIVPCANDWHLRNEWPSYASSMIHKYWTLFKDWHRNQEWSSIISRNEGMKQDKQQYWQSFDNNHPWNLGTPTNHPYFHRLFPYKPSMCHYFKAWHAQASSTRASSSAPAGSMAVASCTRKKTDAHLQKPSWYLMFQGNILDMYVLCMYIYIYISWAPASTSIRIGFARHMNSWTLTFGTSPLQGHIPSFGAVVPKSTKSLGWTNKNVRVFRGFFTNQLKGGASPQL